MVTANYLRAGLVDLCTAAMMDRWGSWWRHHDQMETFSALRAICAGNSPVTGEFTAQRPVARSFDVFFDLCPNKRLSKQSWGWLFESPSRSLWRQCNAWWVIGGPRCPIDRWRPASLPSVPWFDKFHIKKNAVIPRLNVLGICNYLTSFCNLDHGTCRDINKMNACTGERRLCSGDTVFSVRPIPMTPCPQE